MAKQKITTSSKSSKDFTKIVSDLSLLIGKEFDKTHERFDRIDVRLDMLEKRVENIEKQDKEHKMSKLKSDIDHIFYKFNLQ